MTDTRDRLRREASAMANAAPCTTHHHACVCREAQFAKLEAEAADLRTFRDQHTAQLDALGRENKRLRECAENAIECLNHAAELLEHGSTYQWCRDSADEITAALHPKVSNDKGEEKT